MNTYGDFPEIIREVLKIRVGPKYNHGTRSTNNSVGHGFDWSDSPEGYDFWDEILRHEKIEVFFDKYPLNFTCSIDTKGIAKMDFIHKGDSIKRGTIMNATKFSYPYLCGYKDYMKQFGVLESISTLDIDYSKKDWWKILEEGDEVIVVDKETWSRPELGTIIPVVEDDIIRIKENKETVHFNNNQYCVNFTYNMVKLHEKKNKQLNNNIKYESDLSADLTTIRQGLGSTGFSLPGQTCQIATGSRLVGTRKSLGRGQTKTCSGVLTSLQHSIYS